MEQPPARTAASGLVQSLVWMPELSEGWLWPKAVWVAALF